MNWYKKKWTSYAILLLQKNPREIVVLEPEKISKMEISFQIQKFNYPGTWNELQTTHMKYINNWNFTTNTENPKAVIAQPNRSWNILYKKKH